MLVAPMPTPFDEDDRVDFAAIERNLGRWLDTPLAGFVLNSENGEEAFLSEAERREIVRTVHRTLGGRKRIVAGVDCPSATETLRLADSLVEAGADLLRVRIPRLTSAVRGFFEQVAPRAAAPLVVIHQTAPGMFLAGPTPWAAPAEVIGEIVAMDDVFGYIASADLRFEARVRTFVPHDRRFWIGNGSQLLSGAMIGADGGCMMLAGVAPHACHEVPRLAMAGHVDEARAVQTRLLEADWQILSRGAAGLKAALNLLGFEAGRPRAPSPPCDAEGIEQIKTAMIAAELIG